MSVMSVKSKQTAIYLPDGIYQVESDLYHTYVCVSMYMPMHVVRQVGTKVQVLYMYLQAILFSRSSEV